MCHKKGVYAGLFGQTNFKHNLTIRSVNCYNANLLIVGVATFNFCINRSFEVDLPNSVKEIGSYAFAGSKIVNFSFPTSLETISNHAFSGCSDLGWTSTIPDGVTEITSGAFQDCDELQVHISNLVRPHIKKIEDHAFSGCINLKGSIQLEEITHIEYNAFYNCSSLSGNLALPNTLIHLGNSAFDSCTGLTGDLVLPNSLTYLGHSAFDSCTGLNGNITLSENLNTIYSSTFARCTNITGDITIPDKITTIESFAFVDCNNLNGTLTLPDGLKTIGNSAFQNTNFSGELRIPNQVSTIGKSAFEGCQNFAPGSFIPTNLYMISEDCFKNSKAYRQNLNIPEKIDFIDYSAFKAYSTEDFREIKSITLPKNFYEISELSFRGSTKKLKRVTIFAETPPIVKKWVDKPFNRLRRKTPDEIIVFDDVVYDNTTLYVPKGFVDVYRAAPLWSRFTKIQEIIPTTVDQSSITKPYQVITSRHGIRIIDPSKIKEIRFYDTQGRLIHIENGNSEFITTQAYQNQIVLVKIVCKDQTVYTEKLI
ncbi:leucine-rich repeat domain-containing protein [Halosquirtibacter xylanolyticus]|uniref:leucine-rich repeat domain-containing protein n=1 Tax=Halosquirtibacter xylanolyticus TaxID=3374599 RepID=UPI00374799D7|nr:leucine-rich repeat domain-containing protein [Prolixibacteraceae bacterium]